MTEEPLKKADRLARDNEHEGVIKYTSNIPENEVKFALTKHQFERFITDLLGEPEIREGFIEGSFILDIAFVQKLDDLIQDRVLNQNNEPPIQFKSELFFEDNERIVINSLEGLQNFRRKQSYVCTGVRFTWVYLISFFDNHEELRPRKQEIIISSNTFKDSSQGDGKRSSSKLRSSPKIEYTVRYTSPSWGGDISRLLKENIQSSISETNSSRLFFKQRRFYSENRSSFFNLAIFLPSFAVIMYSFGLIIHKAEEEALFDTTKEAEAKIGEEVELSDKIDFLIRARYLNSKELSPLDDFLPFGVAIIWLLIYLVSACLVDSGISLPNYSFFAFTKASEDLKKRFFKSLEKSPFKIVGGFCLGIVSSIAATLILNSFFDT